MIKKCHTLNWRLFVLLLISALTVGLWGMIHPSMLFAGNGRLKFERISLEHGLSQSIVTCIHQDRAGYMWFGTEDGLNRYDGYHFTVFKKSVGKDFGETEQFISHSHVLSICEDNDGYFWVGTLQGGLNRYNPKNETFIHFVHDPNDPRSISNNVVGAVLVDRDGNVWAGTDDGLNKMDKNSGTFKRYKHQQDNPASLSNNVVRVLFEDNRGNLWIGTDGGLNRFNRNTETFTAWQYEINNPNALSNNQIRVIVQDEDDSLWIGTDDGLLNFKLKENVFYHYRHDPKKENTLSSSIIRSILKDKSGVLWVGTNDGGLNKLNPETGTFYHYVNSPYELDSISADGVMSLYEDRSGVIWAGTYGAGISKFHKNREKFGHYKKEIDNPNSLSHNIVWSFCEDDQGILWIGTYDGLNRFDRRKHKFTHYRNDPNNPRSLGHNNVRRLLADGEHIIWVGTTGGGLNKFDKRTDTFTRYFKNRDEENSLSHNDVRLLFKDADGYVWVGTYGGGLNRFDPKTETFTRFRFDPQDPSTISSDYVFSILRDGEGRLWIGSYGGGMNLYHPKTQTFTRFRAEPGVPGRLSNDYVFQIIQSRTGVFWVATWGGGLNRFDPKTQTFEVFSTADGASADSIYGVLEDNQGKLWISTIDGISRFDPVTREFKNYHEIDGLQSNEFNGGSLYKSKSGELFFGGINGFNAFYPDQIKDNTHVPPIVITSFQRLGKSEPIGGDGKGNYYIRLSHADYFFSVEFAALDYVVPGKNLYKYRLEGLDRDWISKDAGRRTATYTTLPPDTYLFRVKGSNSDGVWNEEGATIKIEILPPFWATWWFRLLLAVVLGTIAWMWYKTRMKNLFFRTRMETELQAAQTAQMSIMPQEDPEVKGFDISGICLPANEVGGDFFDYFWLSDDMTRFGVTVGDVSGKAMKAAMTAVMANGIIYSKASESGAVHDVMERLNKSLVAKTDRRVFTALILAAIEPDAGTIRFTNSGLPEPLFKSGNTVTGLKSSGSRFPLGVIKNKQFKEEVVSIQSGDIMIMFTDGVTEAWNSDNMFYGTETLKRFVRDNIWPHMSAREIILKIIDDIKAFSGDALQHDDMTMVVMKAL